MSLAVFVCMSESLMTGDADEPKGGKLDVSYLIEIIVWNI